MGRVSKRVGRGCIDRAVIGRQLRRAEPSDVRARVRSGSVCGHVVGRERSSSCVMPLSPLRAARMMAQGCNAKVGVAEVESSVMVFEVGEGVKPEIVPWGAGRASSHVMSNGEEGGSPSNAVRMMADFGLRSIVWQCALRRLIWAQVARCVGRPGRGDRFEATQCAMYPLRVGVVIGWDAE